MLSEKEYKEQIEKNPKPKMGKRLTYEEFVEKCKKKEKEISKIFKEDKKNNTQKKQI